MHAGSSVFHAGAGPSLIQKGFRAAKTLRAIQVNKLLFLSNTTNQNDWFFEMETLQSESLTLNLEYFLALTVT